MDDFYKIKLEVEEYGDVICIFVLIGEGLDKFCNVVYEKFKVCVLLKCFEFWFYDCVILEI